MINYARLLCMCAVVYVFAQIGIFNFLHFYLLCDTHVRHETLLNVKNDTEILLFWLTKRLTTLL